RLKQVLLNLFSSGVKYNQEGGEVAARVWGSTGNVVMEVADTAAGIAADQLERTFVPFEWLDADERAVAGPGLGPPLARRREHAPDLILLDLHLPDIGGEEVLSRLRSDPKVEDVPVIVLSADATPGQIERLRARGANAYLTKPLDVQQLLETLDAQLDRG